MKTGVKRLCYQRLAAGLTIPAKVTQPSLRSGLLLALAVLLLSAAAAVAHHECELPHDNFWRAHNEYWRTHNDDRGRPDYDFRAVFISRMLVMSVFGNTSAGREDDDNAGQK